MCERALPSELERERERVREREREREEHLSTCESIRARERMLVKKREGQKSR